VKNFIGTSTTEFFLPKFSGVNDTAEIISAVSLTLLKIQQKYFNGKYPHTIQVLEAEKSCLDLIFGFRVSMTPLKQILAMFEAIISANTMPYAKRF
jgi:hypothetical protein